MNQIKTFRTYTALAGFLAETSDDPIAWLARVQVEEIPSPYRYSPVVGIYDWNGRAVVWFETSHRCFRVFEVHPELLRFATEQAAEDWHIRYMKRA